MRQVMAPCSQCVRQTHHNVLHEVDRRVEDLENMYLLLECAGCDEVSLANFWGDGFERYYPSPISRKPPDWLASLQFSFMKVRSAAEEALGELLHEIYEALRGGQRRLAAMGIRALLEQVMIDKVGDQFSFFKNIDAFCQQGYASLVQRDQLITILDAGHAAMHRSYAPSDRDLSTALDIIEGIMASIYVHPDSAEKLAGRVPQRPARLKPPKSDGG